MSKLLHYPPNPVEIPVTLTQPTRGYTTQVIKVIAGLLVFFLVYLALMLGALALAGTFIWGGISLIHIVKDAPAYSFFLFFFAIIIIGWGGLLLFFLIKFMFSPYKDNAHYRVQIHEEEHPRLFAFIRQLTKDMQTSMPKKVYLSPDVNAAVFYNSNFLSMFWPVRKNLEIGLGLVNTVHLSEFKMIIAHELGHFSQRSTKLGSYVYAIHKSIYKMLYLRQAGSTKMLEKWADIASNINIYNVIPHVTLLLMHGIQTVLGMLYYLIHRLYMGLSREMEFHADAVSVAVAGSQPAINSIRRLALSNHCYAYCSKHLAEAAERDACFDNIYSAQTALLHYISKHHQLRMVDGLPEISDEYLAKTICSRVQYKDQWASHPSDQEREARIAAANVKTEMDTTSPWVLFSDSTELQESITQNLYAERFPGRPPAKYRESASGFIKDISLLHTRYRFPEIFAGFYKNRPFRDMKGITEGVPFSGDTKDLYNNAITTRIKRLFQNKIDYALLVAIADKHIDTRHFEFDNQKYERSAARSLAVSLEAEIEEQNAWLQQYEKDLYRFHLHMAEQKGREAAQTFIGLYNNVISHQRKTREIESQATMVIRQVQVLYNMEDQRLHALLDQLKAVKKEEKVLKPLLQNMLETVEVPAELDKTFVEDTRRFLEANYTYLKENTVHQEEIVRLYRLTHRAVSNYTDVTELRKKDYLEFTAALLVKN